MKIKPLPDKLLVQNIVRGERMVGGIVLPDDNGKEHGIRPRWAQVFSVGKNITDIAVGEWVLVEHGRWSREMKLTDDSGNEQSLWSVDYPDGILLVSNELPADETVRDTRTFS